MHGSATISVRSADFQRCFVAISYYFGARAAELTAALDGVGIAAAAADVVSSLGHAERPERARVLGAELGRLAQELERRGAWR
jgi:hypothetical protein